MDVHQTHNSHSFAPHRYVIKPHSLAIPCCLLEWWSNGEVNPDDVTWQTLHAKKRDVFYSVITCDTSFANIWNLFSFLLLLAMTCYDLQWVAASAQKIGGQFALIEVFDDRDCGSAVLLCCWPQWLSCVSGLGTRNLRWQLCHEAVAVWRRAVYGWVTTGNCDACGMLRAWG